MPKHCRFVVLPLQKQVLRILAPEAPNGKAEVLFY
jgi:hypothetical protein